MPRRAAPLLLAFLAGCGGPDAAPPAAGRIQHLVFLSLRDPSEAEALVRDVDASLAGIPGLLRLRAGAPLDTGRPEVTRDYDAAVVLELATVEALRAYLEHPAHRALIERWKPKISRIRIHDVEDRTP